MTAPALRIVQGGLFAPVERFIPAPRCILCDHEMPPLSPRTSARDRSYGVHVCSTCRTSSGIRAGAP